MPLIISAMTRLAAACVLLGSITACVIDATPAAPAPVVVSPAPAAAAPATGSIVVQ
jgi:hypothetical protein